MTKRNIENKALERGGLMLEALAMLGLIAVVTPTMYKKSAERMLEVEDINTAATVRTYSKAAETYMAENLATIIANMEGATPPVNVMTIQPADLTPYLPYKFDVSQNLYDYYTPDIRIYRAGDNLTAFVRFRAKAGAADGIGQERTARIAALVGANGGYMTSGNTARGVGGVWSLDADAYNSMFGDNANQYSLMTSSANIINGSAESGLENSKYLQRTFESDTELWRNAMRTDLYMGGIAGDNRFINDDYPTDHPATDNRHSIRNINSLIVGAENPSADAGAAGLYIAPTDAGNTKPNAFIAGTLTAASSQLFADNTVLQYGAPVNEGDPYNFLVSQTGDVANLGNLDLAKAFNWNSANYIRIGGTNTDVYNVLYANHDATDNSINLSLLNPNEFALNSKDYTAHDASTYSGLLSLMNNGYKKVSTLSSEGAVSYADATAFGSGYIGRNDFQVNIGANTKVDGLLAARQIDAQKLRLSELSAGSDNIDDAEKWLTADSDGVKIKTPTQKRADGLATNVTRAEFDANGAVVQYRGVAIDRAYPAESGGYVAMTGEAGNVQTDIGGNHVVVAAGDNISLRTDGIRTEQQGAELTIGPGAYEDSPTTGTHAHRTTFKDGHVDVVGANFQVLDENNRNVLSVMGNDTSEDSLSNPHNDAMINHDQYSNTDTAVNVAVHGNAVFTSTVDSGNSIHYLTLGKNDTDAAVNIIRGSGETSSMASNRRLLVVDTTQKRGTSGGANQAYVQDRGLTADEASDAPTSYTMDPGTIYIRKGLLDVSADKNPSSGRTSSAASTGTGIIRASRLVANNMDSDGNFIKVPEIFSSAVYNEYNDTTTDPSKHTNRYDTYMVNPAYTSVMNDIKLVSRAGARLSDILPDFIIKGIYLVNNDYDDKMTSLSFQLSGSNREIDAPPDKNSSFPWASPYSGVVPAPQCPPGYMRVITVTPTGLRMADAGHMARADNLGNGEAGIYVSEYINAAKLQNVTSQVQMDSHNVTKYMPDYAELEVENSPSSATMRLSTNDGVSTVETKTYDVEAVNNLPVVAREYSGATPLHYVLAAEDRGALEPLVIQQSTWFKALSVPLVSGTARSWQKTYGNDGYQRGWAILLGFVYPRDIYQNFAQQIGMSSRHELAGGYYWNLFPVMKTSLEAYATTYCYFDRYNETHDYGGNASDHIHKYDPANYIPTDYRKAIDPTYDRNLNDPSMKYNERW